MQVDFDLLKHRVDATIADLKNGLKSPERVRKLALTHVSNLESHITNGEFGFRADAAHDAGGAGLHARPMDYVLGGLLSCQHMWCLRWAALNGKRVSDISIDAHGHFTWQGEYLEEVDSGLRSIDIVYHLASPDMTLSDVKAMSETVARRCPVFATLRKATPIAETTVLNGQAVYQRIWQPSETQPRSL